MKDKTLWELVKLPNEPTITHKPAKIPSYVEIIPHIPESGIDEFDLASKLGLSVVSVNHALSKCPSVECSEGCVVSRWNGQTYTVFNRIWRHII